MCTIAWIINELVRSTCNRLHKNNLIIIIRFFIFDLTTFTYQGTRKILFQSTNYYSQAETSHKCIFFNPISPQQWETKEACKNTHKVHSREYHAKGNVDRRLLILDGSHRGVILAEQVPPEPQPRRLGRDEVAVETSATAQPEESQDNQRHRDLQPHICSIFSCLNYTFLSLNNTRQSEDRTIADRDRIILGGPSDRRNERARARAKWWRPVKLDTRLRRDMGERRPPRL